MKLIICEKFSQAKKFAEVLSQYTNKELKHSEGGFSNGEITIACAQGHLIKLCDPEDYNPNFKQWDMAALPIIPEQFNLRPIEDASKKKLLSNIKKLIPQASVIYNATDAEREGELIFRYIFSYLNPNTNAQFKRIWASDLQYETIVKAYENAKPLQEYDNLYACAKARSESDWLIGINATRMLSLSTNSHMKLTLGRVQTAVLRLIVERYLANTQFKSQKTFTPIIKIKDLELELNKYLLDQQKAQKLLENLPNPATLEKEVKQEKMRQPTLFSLVDIQILASKKYNLSASDTLATIQNLYENSLVSYPRTDSNYLTKAQVSEALEILNKIKDKSPFLKQNSIELSDFIEVNENHFIFNDAKTSDHYALIPLNADFEKAKKIGEKESLLFYEIVKRFTQCFMKEAIIEKTVYRVPLQGTIDLADFFSSSSENTDNPEEKKIFFRKNGETILYQGFLKFEDKNDKLLPNITSGQYPIEATTLREGKTDPPKLFTEASLLKAMKNPLNYQEGAKENITNKEVAKELSLGTPATNDKFLPILIDRGYAVFQKKNVLPTQLGIAIVEKLKHTKIADVSLTLTIEEKLAEIRSGKVSYTAFMNSTRRYTQELMGQIQQSGKDISLSIEKPQEKEHIKCPQCKTGNIYLSKTPNKNGNLNYYCSNYKNDDPSKICNFNIFDTIAGKKLTEKNIKDLCEKGETATLQFTNKTGHKYNAKIVLKDFKTELVFADDKKIKKPTKK